MTCSRDGQAGELGGTRHGGPMAVIGQARKERTERRASAAIHWQGRFRPILGAPSMPETEDTSRNAQHDCLRPARGDRACRRARQRAEVLDTMGPILATAPDAATLNAKCDTLRRRDRAAQGRARRRDRPGDARRHARPLRRDDRADRRRLGRIHALPAGHGRPGAARCRRRLPGQARHARQRDQPVAADLRPAQGDRRDRRRRGDRVVPVAHAVRASNARASRSTRPQRDPRPGAQRAARRARHRVRHQHRQRPRGHQGRSPRSSPACPPTSSPRTSRAPTG